MLVQLSSGGRSGSEEQRAKAISHIGAPRHSKHEISGFRTIMGVQRHTCRDAVGHGRCYLLMRCSCFDVSFTVYSVFTLCMVSQCGKHKRSLSASLCPVPSPFWSWQHFNRGSSACLQVRVCSVRVRRHGSTADCSGRTSGGYRPHGGRAAADWRRCGYLSRGLGRRSRCALLFSVPWVAASPVSATWSTCWPICGRTPCATSGFHKAKLSATFPPWKLVTLEWCDASRGHAWVSPRKSVGSCTDPQAADPALVVHSQSDASIGSGSLGTSLPSHGSSSRFLWTQRWTQSSRAFRRQKYRKRLPTTSGCEEQTPPRTSSRPWSKSVLSISSLPPTWSLLPISHSSDLMARGCCANSLTSTGPSCLPALGNGRNCPDHLPSIFRWASFRVYRTALCSQDPGRRW